MGHPKVPEITNQPLNTMLPVLPNGAVHPEPYYITQNVVLSIPSGRPPWLENIKTTERLVRDTWKRNEALQNAMLDEFIKDTLHAEIVGIVSSTLTVSNMHFCPLYLEWKYTNRFDKILLQQIIQFFRRTN